MAHCSSPGCSRKHEPPAYQPPSETSSCGSPGCPGRAICHSRRQTQAPTRPADPSPKPGPLKRPRSAKGFSTLLLQATAGDLVLVAALYRDVQKFGGLKLAVYEASAWAGVDRTSLDPHFYADDKGPVARFRPDAVGLGLALSCVSVSSTEREAFIGLVNSFGQCQQG